jgi:hypothetical protein
VRRSWRSSRSRCGTPCRPRRPSRRQRFAPPRNRGQTPRNTGNSLRSPDRRPQLWRRKRKDAYG